jgi:hypothetical protein
MAFTASAPTCTYISQLQSSSTFKLNPLLLNPRRVCTHRRPSVRAVSTISNAALDSGNGAALAPEKPDHAAPYYGRQFFPLAAVVGQVQTLFLSLKNVFFGLLVLYLCMN